MGKRLKTKSPLVPIDSWDKADEILKYIGDCQLNITAAQQKAKDAIDEAKAELAEAIKPLNESIDVYVRSLEAFAAAHAPDFGSARSKKLSFGCLGWRKSTFIKTKKTTLDLIREVFSSIKAKMFIRTTEAVDKEAMAKLTDEELAVIDARREVKDAFFAEPDLPKVVDYVD